MRGKLKPFLLLAIVLSIFSVMALAQARLVLNGGIVKMNNGAFLVIDNPDNAAISRQGSGYLCSEAADNTIRWRIAAGSGNSYLLPFGNSQAYFPLQIKAGSGTGNGYFVFSTYPTGTAKNSDQLPPGVSNANKDGLDNSLKMIDRFWQIAPHDYSKNPTLNIEVLAYNKSELAAPNTIAERALSLQRWNPGLQSWNDAKFPSTVNLANSELAIASIEGTQLFNWFTMTDLSVAVSGSSTHFTASAANGKVLSSWQTLAEQNFDHFEVWRSRDGVTFEYVGTVMSLGNNAGINNYAFSDNNPLAGISYYQLKTIDKNAAAQLSAIVMVSSNAGLGLALSPNPASNTITINSSANLIASRPLARLYDDKGRLLQTFALTDSTQTLTISSLPKGIYQLTVTSNEGIQTSRFIKQ